ncbi:hypothetical protein F0562_024120 [Nyssa sinensis]|uniref:Retrotransposon gag domain-containing protein n=1 Tax=Nyssa sinensis TaxID=561372 RepID=A0A5J5BMG5_9ASTE|nr:hypothetical protein F0562_024120 [Nyssa sinensis]
MAPKRSGPQVAAAPVNVPANAREERNQLRSPVEFLTQHLPQVEPSTHDEEEFESKEPLTTHSMGEVFTMSIPYERIEDTFLEIFGSCEGKHWSGLDNRILKEPTATDPMLKQWRSSNSLVMSWLLNSMQPHISRGFLFLKTTYEIWTAVAQTYSQVGNDARIYDLRMRVHETKQKHLSVAEYYANLNETSPASIGDADHLTSEELQGKHDQEKDSSPTQENMFFQSPPTRSEREKVTIFESTKALAKPSSRNHGGRLDKADLKTYVRSRQAPSGCQDMQIDSYVPPIQSQSL